ncbi:MAG: putative amidophosphoribosyltransferase [Candidatus Saccharibacteria bacterium]|nr:putative amidophosphoribosyltransferase [Candidatus Saccharibacteria bacterium]MDB5180396.1 putative amidophosphoribosyltransferase [Candidatus Saccharibacteria bacterium]
MQTVAPHPCFGCGKIGTTLCDNCKYNIIDEPFSGCILCGNVSPEALCAQHDAPICKAWVVAERRTVLRRVIDAYKFEYVKAAGHTLIELLDAKLPILPADTIIIPIPTAPSHIRQRGYDHLEILARLLGRRREMPVTHLLLRSSAKTQHRLNKVERQQEASGAFHISPHLSIDSNTPILLLDDIVTTGSTITSAARVLADAGFKTVFVAALAYQPLD